MADKTSRIIERAAECEPPWDFVQKEEGDRTTLVLTRGEERIEFAWEKNALQHPLLYTLAGVREVRLRNVSAALKQMGEKPNYRVRRTSRAAGAEREVREDVGPLMTTLPFELDDDDATIIKAVRGHSITWRRTMQPGYETGMVPGRYQVDVPDGKGGKKKVWRTSPNIYLRTTSTGRRVLTFPAVNEQFRSCALDQIVSVS